MSNKLTHILGAAAILTAFSLPGLAQDSIAPLTFNATIPVGTSTSVNKVVTVGKVSKPVDIMFLLDSTGSMGGTLTSIASQFSSSTVPSANSFATDVQFGVGNYKDVGDPYVYQLNQDISASDAAAQAALTALTACCGGDTPEGQVYALQQAALTTTWRPGSQRILIWVGDAPGHDPRNGVTLAQAITALQSQGIIVISASSTSGPGLNTTGQATAVAAATGGSFLGTFNDATINAAIQNAITNAIAMYSKVSLQVSPVPAGVTVNISPASYVGSFNRSSTINYAFTVNFTGTFPGNYVFNINALIDDVQALTDRGLPVREVDNITVTALPPVISKSFNPLFIRPGGTSRLTFTIQNPNLAIMPGVGFTDNLPPGVTVAVPNGFSASGCGGIFSIGGGGTSVTFSAGSIAASSTCTLAFDVTSTEGIKNNATSNVTSSFGTGNVATARLVAANPPTISKAFGVAVLPLNGVTTLTFSIGNPNPTVPLTAVSVVDNLPAGLRVGTPSVVANSCGGAVTAVAGSGSISLAGGAIAAASNCTITVNVTGTIPGLQINVTDPITSLEGGTNGVATARITIGGNFLISYAANLTNGDSVVNLTNTGALGASLNGPGFGGAAGNICMNVYAFSPDEQLVACCSCLVTPNGLAALSIKDDLISNTLTGVRPNSVVVKIVPTGAGAAFTGTSCTNSAAVAGQNAANPLIVDGGLAWGTSLHALGTGFAPTENPFRGGTLSAQELASITNRCTNIIGNGSTFGICRSCRAGGLEVTNR